MKRLAALSLFLGLSLALVAIAVFALGDREILVRPPSAVAEGFVRQIAAGRYDRARPYLSRELRDRTSTAFLRSFHDAIESLAGEIQDVRGEAGGSGEEAAEAFALVSGERRRLSLPFEFRRENGLWEIATLPLPALGAGPVP